MKTKSILLCFLLFAITTLNAQDYYPLEVGKTWNYNMFDEDGTLVGIDSMVCLNSSISGDTVFYHFVNYIDYLSGGTDKDSTTYYNSISDSNKVFILSEDDDLNFFLHNYIPYNDNPPLFSMDGFLSITPVFIGDYSIDEETFHNCYWLKLNIMDSTGFVVAPGVGTIAAISDSIPVRKLAKTNFIYNTEIVPPECTVNMEVESGAVWLTPASGYLQCNYFAVTNVGRPMLETDEIDGGDFSAAPLANNQTIMSYEGQSNFTITFENPVSNLRLYARWWRSHNYAFNQPYTILSGSGFEVNNDTLSVVGTWGNGIIEFAGPLTELTVTTDQPCCSAQSFTLGLAKGDCSDSFHTFATAVCGSYISPSGKKWTATGTYNDTIPNKEGCDSIITIGLTILKSTTSNLTETICGSYTSPSGKVWSVSGSYADTIPNSAGCDSIIAIELNIDCESSLQRNNEKLVATIYPNPTNEIVNLELDEYYENISIEVINHTGQVISRGQYQNVKQIGLNLTGEKGFYTIRVSCNNKPAAVFKVMKN